MDQIRVVLQATDPLSQAGLVSVLQSRPEFSLLSPSQQAAATVFVMSTDRLTAEAIATLRRWRATSGAPVVLVINEIDEGELLIAVEPHVVAVLPRSAVTMERLSDTLSKSAFGGGVAPPNLVGELLKHIEQLQRDALTPVGLAASDLTPREAGVLRLVADGLDTAQIADQLCYSERTVKNVIRGLINRLNLRNRSHAVAHALRSGMI